MAHSRSRVLPPFQKNRMASLFESLRRFSFELHKRRVYRAAATYAIGAWLVLQIADIAFPLFGISLNALRVVASIAVLGFPLSALLAWFYQITPSGIVPDGAPESGAQTTFRCDLCFMTLALSTSLVLVGLLGVSAHRQQPRIAIRAIDPVDRNGSDVVFARGLVEELARNLGSLSETGAPGVGLEFDHPITHELWIDVEEQRDRLNVRVTLLETDQRDAYRYIDVFDVPNGPLDPAEQAAAARIAEGVERAVSDGSWSTRLESLVP